jgi:hypothetical protein
VISAESEAQDILFAADEIVQVSKINPRGLRNVTHGGLGISFFYEKLRSLFYDLELPFIGSIPIDALELRYGLFALMDHICSFGHGFPL